ncbi:hypothetical protein [Parabacteroides sp. Marseille-P3160]|uniref:hypothetical protein n=1 Tax=Parabacteroides sp. Marseille-P3160 TaxID=1917887 RepID=UPI0009B9ADAD|nr:hypothetical protein [Parabacteroides sp. Marseille-P3160]
MKKLLLSFTLLAAISFGATINAQDVKAKKEPAKTESCCKKEAKSEKTGCSTTKTAENKTKKSCCSAKASDKKVADATTKKGK